jgi:hypothetical protein
VTKKLSGVFVRFFRAASLGASAAAADIKHGAIGQQQSYGRSSGLCGRKTGIQAAGLTAAQRNEGAAGAAIHQETKEAGHAISVDSEG